MLITDMRNNHGIEFDYEADYEAGIIGIVRARFLVYADQTLKVITNSYFESTLNGYSIQRLGYDADNVVNMFYKALVK